jgi:hypothetical protein
MQHHSKGSLNSENDELVKPYLINELNEETAID